MEINFVTRKISFRPIKGDTNGSYSDEFTVMSSKNSALMIRNFLEECDLIGRNESFHEFKVLFQSRLSFLKTEIVPII